jgi:tRNA 2-thiocytidine biosynthesis protein TtcA
MGKKTLNKAEEIERSITKDFRFSIWSPFIAAIKRYELIKPGDKVAVCISGGKDSNLLAECFKLLYRHSDFPFEVKYLVMNPGYNESNLEMIKSNLKTMDIPAEIIETDIFEIANAQDHSPCYLCAKMRRGALYRLAQGMGCNKIALGHHYDDVIETILMNLLHAGSFQTMLPKLHSDHFEGMELIRPLYLVREDDIKAWRDANSLSFIQCACRFTENVAKEDAETASARLETKMLIKELKQKHPQVEKNIFKSAENVVLDKVIGYKTREGQHSFLDDYENKK